MSRFQPIRSAFPAIIRQDPDLIVSRGGAVRRIVVTTILLGGALPGSAAAAGHGPVFGAATPTLGKGAWPLDQAWMGRISEDHDNEQLLRTMISFGVTENLQMSASLPILLESPVRMPTGRMMATMSDHRDLEGLLAWRFHHQPIGQNGRFEATVYGGGTVPLQNQYAGMATTPSVYVSVSTGYVSRAHYLWVGAGYQRFGGGSGDRFGDVSSYSLVYGNRPKVLRLDYPKPDLRFFVEAVGERTGPAHHASILEDDGHGHQIGGPTVDGHVVHPAGGGHVVLVGPTALLLYKAYAIAGGLQIPIIQRLKDAGQPKERFRFALNVSYFFWSN